MVHLSASDDRPDLPEQVNTGTGKGNPDARWLRWARRGCILANIMMFGVFLLTLPTYYTQLQTLCRTADCSFGQLTLQDAQILATIPVSLHAYSTIALSLVTSVALLCLIIAILLLWHPSENWFALLVSALIVVLGVSGSTDSAPVLRSWFGPIGSVPLAGIINYLGAIALPLIFALFPNGRYIPAWTRWLVSGMLVTGVLFALPVAPPPTLSVLTTFVWASGMLVLAGTQIHRYRRFATPRERQQTKWVIFGFALALFILLGTLLPVVFLAVLRQPTSAYYTLWGLVANMLLIVPVVVALGVAILRYHLWDIDIIIHRTLVYGLLTATVIGLYVVVVGYLGALFRTGGNLAISLVATGLVAVLFQPLRGWLQRGVNRLIYGQRDEPYAVLSRLGQRLEATLAPDAVLPAIAETVAQALKLPYVAVTLKDGDGFPVVAAHGSPVDAPLLLPLAYQTELIGQLVLGPRQRGETFTPADRRLLEDLARQVGIAAHDVRLMGELQRSRERLVTTLEEERRRLRRDLHDGLGSTLTSLMFKLDATDTLLDRDLPVARTLLAEVRGHMQTSIAEIRHLVYNLRPPTLDEWGLVGALREHVAQYALGEVQVILEVPETVPSLPAAVEVATYRIALEALANVVKHAHATQCIIYLDMQPETLTMEVRDNGVGMPASAHAGVGTMAMRERAAELGGACEIDAVPPHGTRIRVSIPVRKA